MSGEAVGVDIGGTAVKLGLVLPGGVVIRRDLVPTDPRDTFEDLVRRVATAIEALTRGGAPAAIGISTPGRIDRRTQRIISGADNVPMLKDGDIAAALRQRAGAPCAIENDGVCAAAGELLYGAGRRFGRFALATLGTGVGGSVVLDGKVVTGRDHPPEFGAICLDPGRGELPGPIPGMLEHLASAPALCRRYAALGGGTGHGGGHEILARAEAGDRPHASPGRKSRRRWRKPSALWSTCSTSGR